MKKGDKVPITPGLDALGATGRRFKHEDGAQQHGNGRDDDYVPPGEPAAKKEAGKKLNGGGADNKEQRRALTDEEFDAEIKRLAALPRLRYERERESAATALDISAPRLDKLIAAERKGDGPRLQGRPLEFAEHEPWPEPVDGAALLSEIAAAIKRHVVLSDQQADTVALWILHTFVFDEFQCTPRLAITSPDKGCGKTTLMDVIKELAPRAKSTESIFAASIFRLIELYRPTLRQHVSRQRRFARDSQFRP